MLSITPYRYYIYPGEKAFNDLRESYSSHSRIIRTIFSFNWITLDVRYYPNGLQSIHERYTLITGENVCHSSPPSLYLVLVLILAESNPDFGNKIVGLGWVGMGYFFWTPKGQLFHRQARNRLLWAGIELKRWKTLWIVAGNHGH